MDCGFAFEVKVSPRGLLVEVIIGIAAHMVTGFVGDFLVFEVVVSPRSSVVVLVVFVDGFMRLAVMVDGDDFTVFDSEIGRH